MNCPASDARRHTAELLGRFLLVTVLVGTAFSESFDVAAEKHVYKILMSALTATPRIGSKRLFPWLGKWPPTEKTNSRFA